MSDRIPVRRALLGVYDKSGIEELARGLSAAGVELVKVACPGFVELVEAGRISGPETLRVVRRVLKPTG